MGRRHQGHEPLHARGTCRSCSLRRRTIVRRGGRPTAIPRHFWSWNEERILRKSVGVMEIPEIQALLLEDAGTVRTESAIKIHALQIGLSMRRVGGYPIRGVARVMGVSPWVVRQWIQQGLLHPSITSGGYKWVTTQELCRFAAEYPDRYDARYVIDLDIRNAAQAARARDQWLDAKEIARVVGCHQETVRKFFQEGKLHGVKEPHWRGHPGGHRWVARREDVFQFVRGRKRPVPPGSHQEALGTAPR